MIPFMDHGSWRVCLCLIIGFGAATPALTQEGGAADKEERREVERVLTALDEKQKELEDLEAKFVQTQVNHLLQEPDVSRGRLYWRDGRLRMDWLEPDRSVLILDEEGMLLHLPEERRAERYPAKGKEGFGALFPGFGQTSEQMRKTYAIRLEPAPKGGSTWKLVLRPRGEKVKRWVGTITLWIDREKGVPTRIRMDDPNGKDYTETTLSETKLNRGIPESRFRLKLPEGTRVTTVPGGLPF